MKRSCPSRGVDKEKDFNVGENRRRKVCFVGVFEVCCGIYIYIEREGEKSKKE